MTCQVNTAHWNHASSHSAGIQHCLEAPEASGGRSIAGFPEKNPSGFSMKPVTSTGITGKSSTRGTCVTPKLCHSTMSCPSTFRSAAVHFARPSAGTCPFSTTLCVGNSPACSVRTYYRAKNITHTSSFTLCNRLETKIKCISPKMMKLQYCSSPNGWTNGIKLWCMFGILTGSG